MDCNNGKEVKESVFMLDVKQLQQQPEALNICSCSPPPGSVASPPPGSVASPPSGSADSSPGTLNLHTCTINFTRGKGRGNRWKGEWLKGGVGGQGVKSK